jgi:hypothetical protein
MSCFAVLCLQVKKAGQPRDMDNLFHVRLAQLESNMGNMKNEIQLAVSDVLEGTPVAAEQAVVDYSYSVEKKRIERNPLCSAMLQQCHNSNNLGSALASPLNFMFRYPA